MYEVTQTLVVGKAESYPEAKAIAEDYRGHGRVIIQTVGESGWRETVALCTEGGKWYEQLKDKDPSYLGERM